METAHHSLASSPEPSHHSGMSLGNKLALATAALAGGIIIAPYIPIALGMDDHLLAEKSLNALCGTGQATGLAGSLKDMLIHVPLIGESLAQGGWTNVAAVTATGMGGHFLAKAAAHYHTDTTGICWSKVIRYSALAATMLIALPSILTGISAGLVYLSAILSDTELASQTLSFMKDTLGTTGTTSALAGVAGLAATAPHLLTCGLSLFPATLPFLMQEKKAISREAGELQMDAAISSPLTPGEPTTLLVRLTDASPGQPVTEDQLATIHEKKLHLFLIDESLGDYHHLHPTPTGAPGVFRVEFTPNSGGNYHLWAQAVQQQRGIHETLHTLLPAEHHAVMIPDFRIHSTTEKEGLTFQWKASPPLRVGQDSIVSLWVTDSNGHPVNTLEPLLGAMAHLVGFSADGQHFQHLHPISTSPLMPLQFHISPEHEGATRFFLQVNCQGREITASFDQGIYPAKQHTTGFVSQVTHPQPLQVAASFAR